MKCTMGSCDKDLWVFHQIQFSNIETERERDKQTHSMITIYLPLGVERGSMIYIPMQFPFFSILLTVCLGRFNLSSSSRTSIWFFFFLTSFTGFFLSLGLIGTSLPNTTKSQSLIQCSNVLFIDWKSKIVKFRFYCSLGFFTKILYCKGFDEKILQPVYHFYWKKSLKLSVWHFDNHKLIN